MKKQIRLTEGDLHRIVKESVKNVLNEVGKTPEWQWLLGRLAARKTHEGDIEAADSIYDYARKAHKTHDGIGSRPLLDKLSLAYYDGEEDQNDYYDAYDELQNSTGPKKTNKLTRRSNKIKQHYNNLKKSGFTKDPFNDVRAIY